MRAHLQQVDLRAAELDLALLVEPAERVLLEAAGGVGRLGRQMAHSPLVVEPRLEAVHAQVDEVVEVLATRNERVEAHAAQRLVVHGGQAAAQRVRARQAGAAHGLLDVLVVELVLLPGAVVPVALVGCAPRALAVEEVAGLDEDRDAAAGLSAQAVAGALDEVLVLDDLVVVDEDDRVVTEDGREREADVADGAIACKRDACGDVAKAQLLEALVDERDLIGAHGDDAQAGEVGRDGAHPRHGGALGALLAGDEQHDAANAVHVVERLQAAVQRTGRADV